MAGGEEPEEIEVFVCQAGTCRAHGSEAVLTEIEELGKAVGTHCSVRPTGCVGYCSQAPNAVVRKHGGTAREQIEVETKIRSLEASIKVVERATGRMPRLEDPELSGRFAKMRAHRAREHARELSHWNAALRGLQEDCVEQPELLPQLKELLGSAGFKDGVIGEAISGPIKDYTQWTLDSMTPVSRHSVVYTYRCKDRKRGTPHPRGRGRKPELKTWHTTLLAEVGPNSEGPLPWVEREYTPVSTAAEWEKGRVDLLVKIYPLGSATSWLHKTAPPTVWLSKPVKTLGVPSLSADASSAFSPKSVLLLLAGTGVVALPQILHHRDPMNKLGLATHRRDQLRVPIDCVLSFRADDVLMLPQLAKWCTGGEEAGVRDCTLLLTDANTDTPPFPDVSGGDKQDALETLKDLANARIITSRSTADIVAHAVGQMARPCRVVVSGPDGFNSAARKILAPLLDEEAVTILSA